MVIGKTISHKLLAVAVVAAALLLPGSPAGAGSTDPTLAIGQVVARPAGPGSVLEVTGIFGFDDVLQVSYPLNLVVSQGTRFVRFEVGAVPQSGTFSGLSDGLDTTEIAALEAAGQDEPQAEILWLAPNRLLVALPPSILDGTVTAVLYVELPGEGSFVSNAVTTTLLGTSGGGP